MPAACIGEVNTHRFTNSPTTHFSYMRRVGQQAISPPVRIVIRRNVMSYDSISLIKQQAKALGKSEGIPLSSAQELFARKAKFSSFHDLTTVSSRNPDDPRLMRAACMRPAKSSTQPRKARTWCALKFRWAPVLAF